MKYYNWKTKKYITIPKKIGTDNGYKGKQDNLFVYYQSNVKIFIESINFDEYEEDDPYLVKENLQSSFHQNRINSTLHLVNCAVKDMKSDNLKILDVGCGQGHITSRIYEMLPNAEISAFDYSVTAIQYAINHFENIDFIVADAYNMPYAPEYFDIVVCNNIWEHVKDPLNLLGEIKKISKTDAYLIISTPSRYRLSNLIKIILGRPVSLISKNHVTEYTVGQIKEQLKFGGYVVKKEHSLPIKYAGKSFTKKLFLHSILKSILKVIIKFVNSHHSLESTVFYLSKRTYS